MPVKSLKPFKQYKKLTFLKNFNFI